MNNTAPLSLADQLAFILERLRQALSRHAEAQRLTGRASLIGPFLVAIWQRVGRIGHHFAARAAREATGPIIPRLKPTPEPVIARREAARQSRTPPHPGYPEPPPLPRYKAWLLSRIPETGPITVQLRQFMADPEVAALLAASPRLCSILNPLCHMLGIEAASIQAEAIRRAKAVSTAALSTAALSTAAVSTAAPPPSQPPDEAPDALPISIPIPIPIPGHAADQAAPLAAPPCPAPPSPAAPPPEFSHALA